MIKTIDEKKCTGCYTCVELCTKDVLRFDDKKKKPYVAYFSDCQTCFNCEVHCPAGAVYVDPIHKKKVLPW